MNHHVYSKFAALLGLILSALVASSQTCGVIPTPQKILWQEGTFTLDSSVQFLYLPSDDIKVYEAVTNFYFDVAERHPNIPFIYAKSPKALKKAKCSSIECYLVDTLPTDTFPEQAYTLDIAHHQIVIKAITSTGLFYGLQSLKQMCRYFDNGGSSIQLPCLSITDYPSLQYRGWLDDISRGPIPNMDFYEQMIATLSDYKLNFFNFYTEHVFKLDSCPDIAPTDGLTALQIEELEAIAAYYNIEIFGNQQALAHAEKTLRIPFYQDMADTKSNYNPASPATYRFLEYQLGEVAKAYQSPFFNINSDETEGLGSGKAKAYVDSVGASMAYVQHIIKVHDILKKQDKRVMMWGDIAAKDPEIVKLLPKDLLMIVWSYVPADHFESMMLPFTKAGFEFMVAPGVSMWGTVFPSMENYVTNIANMVRDGQRHGAIGMMNTAWDDSGESLMNSAWHALIWGAEMAWNPIHATDPEAAREECAQRLQTFNRIFEKQFLHTSIDNIQHLKIIEHTDIQDFAGFGTLYDALWDFYPTKVNAQYVLQNQQIYDQLAALQKTFELPEGTEPDVHNAMLRIAHYVCQREMFVAERNILRYLLYLYSQDDSSQTLWQGMNRAQLGQALRETYIPNALHHLYFVKSAYMKLWDEENRPYSRNIVEARFDKVAQDLLNIPYHVMITPVLNENGETLIRLQSLLSDDTPIYYTMDGRTPRKGEIVYDKPIKISQSTMIKTLTINEMNENVFSDKYVLLHKALGHISKLNTDFSTYRPQYAAGGVQALADGLLGGDYYGDGHWQGYWGDDIDVEFDFGKVTALNTFNANFLQNGYDWILAPKVVELYVSDNGKDYKLYKTLNVPHVRKDAGTNGIFPVQATNLQLKTRYVRVVVKNAGPLPEWHQAAGQKSYLFADEFIFN